LPEYSKSLRKDIVESNQGNQQEVSEDLWFSNPHIQWVKDRDRIFIVDEITGSVYALARLPAAVWSWLNLGYGYDSLLEFVACMLKVSTSTAQVDLDEMLREWQELGFIIRDFDIDG
jgi:hypothetical protein